MLTRAYVPSVGTVGASGTLPGMLCQLSLR